MATLASPQSQAGVLSFYDAPTKGPKMNPKIVMGVIIAVAVIILVIDKVAMFYG